MELRGDDATCGASAPSAYRTRTTHAAGADLDVVVEMCNPHARREGRSTSRPAAATSPGGCARQGAEVVTLDPSPGHASRTSSAPPRTCRSPTARSTSSSRASRAHHFDDVGTAVGEMARVVERACVVVEDTLYTSRGGRGRPRSCATRRTCATTREDEWRELLESAGLEVERVERFAEDARVRRLARAHAAAPAPTPSACASCSRRGRPTTARPGATRSSSSRRGSRRRRWRSSSTTTRSSSSRA